MKFTKTLQPSMAVLLACCSYAGCALSQAAPASPYLSTAACSPSEQA